MLRSFLFAAILAFGVGRFLITPRLNLPTVEGSYEAFAHLFAGGLFGAWLNSGKPTPYVNDWSGNRDPFLWRSFWGLSLLELGMFLLQKSLSGG